MPMRVGLAHDIDETVPVRWRLGRHEVVLVGHRPPDIGKGGETANEIAQIAIVLFGTHARKAPAVVWVKEDEIGLDAEGGKVIDAFFKVPEISRLEPFEVELPSRYWRRRGP